MKSKDAVRHERSFKKVDIARTFGVDIKTIERAVTSGKLVKHSSNWFREGDILNWLGNRKNGPKIKQKLEEYGVAATGSNGKTKLKPSGGGLVSDSIIDKLSNVAIPASALANAGQVADLAKSVATMVSTDEKQMRTLTDAGRLADIREVEHLLNEFLAELVEDITKLDTQIESDVSYKTKIKLTEVRKVLIETKKYLIKILNDKIDELGKRREEFIRDQTGEVRKGVKH